jgi:hypothetical protein
VLALRTTTGSWDAVIRLDVVALSALIIVVVDVPVVRPLGVERRNLCHGFPLVDVGELKIRASHSVASPTYPSEAEALDYLSRIEAAQVAQRDEADELVAVKVPDPRALPVG